MNNPFQFVHDLQGNRLAQPDETIHGSASSLHDDYVVVYPIGTKTNGVICRFHNRDDQWECYCNDVLLEIGADGFVSLFDITKRRDGQ